MRTCALRSIGLVTLIVGTLDILSAFAFGAASDVGPGQILRYVASGPFGRGMRQGGVPEAVVGLAVHFILMAIMVAVFFGIVRRARLARSSLPWVGILYGLLIYGVMYWLVLPARFGGWPETDLWNVSTALFSHIVCVGLPMGFLAKWLIPAGLCGEDGAARMNEAIGDA
jgi:hypothetical protein